MCNFFFLEYVFCSMSLISTNSDTALPFSWRSLLNFAMEKDEILESDIRLRQVAKRDGQLNVCGSSGASTTGWYTSTEP